ncbi:MAG TPA: NGG1p interacting factor NIF3 [Caldisericia bacterium]|nr:NGG1p interacting factor NIF3 [Caldisericia bacterium]HPP43973.1 NGG1p interacting factor NIF3 [Caldisericia bacterium]
MKLKEIYELFISTGIKNDPRGEKEVNDLLNERKKEYNKLSDEEKEYFDKETLTNPYGDTRILYGTGEEEIKSLIAGIDVDTGEIILGKQLGFDLIFSHHPRGVAFLNLPDVMKLQEDALIHHGIPINISQKMMAKRISEVDRALTPQNAYRVVDSARLLNQLFMCCHTPADNSVQRFLTELFNKEKPKYLKDVIDLLLTIPEYKQAKKMGFGPKIFSGDLKSKAGKVVIDMTGGTEGAKELMKKHADAGIGTIVGMHFSEEHKKEAEENYINLVVAGHMSSDSIGVNLLLDQVEKVGVKVESFSGLIRIKRS